MTEMADAELLIKAGALMIQRAANATASPWVAQPVYSKNSPGLSAVYSHAHPTGTVASEVIASGSVRRGYGGTRNPADAIHIAGMQPSVAKRIGEWLQSNGGSLRSSDGELKWCDNPDEVEIALSIAREYLAPTAAPGGGS